LERYNGHCKALTDNGLIIFNTLQVDAFTTEESGYQATCELIEKNIPFDALFGASDLIAIGAMRALQEHHFKVPEQVSVVGFDDIAIASFTMPALTTAKQDTILAGELLVDNLIALINGEKPGTTLIPTTVIVRKSCGS